MGYQTIILPEAEGDLDRLTPAVRHVIIKKLEWLSKNAEVVIHHPLKGMPSDLVGLCKLRLGDYRILYWKADAKKQIQVFKVQHRSVVYRGF